MHVCYNGASSVDPLISFGYCLPASGGFDEVVRELLGAGAEVTRTNDKGITPL